VPTANRRPTPRPSSAGAEEFRRLAQNRRARHDYEILETIEAGLALQGSEVKSLRTGRLDLRDAYARIDDGEAWLVGLRIPEYGYARGFGAHVPDRRRKLLLHRHQIDRLVGLLQQNALTLVPLSLYLRRGLVKVELGVARGRKNWDRRRVLAEREASREAERAMADARRGRFR
jgi:SsrA-binding protein